MADSERGDEDPPSPSRYETCRNGVAFWLFGVCNNAPYVVMLSAAHDILNTNQLPPAPHNGTRHDCGPISTGAVLLADILPSLLIKMAAPFGAHLVPYSVRVVTVAVAAWGGTSMVAMGAGIGVSLWGVAVSSFSSGLGEVTFLTLSSHYDSTALWCWSSGSGAAGLLGALLYVGLTQGGLLTPHRALLPLLMLPHTMMASFFFLLRPPRPDPEEQPLLEPRPTSVGPSGGDKWGAAKVLLCNAVPLALVYFFEYFINQGLLELLYFPKSWLTHSEQYRWFQLCYQSSVFVSRSSLRCCRFRHIWILALTQGLIAATLLWAVASDWLPSFGPALALVLLEGTVGGGAYANAYSNINEEAPPRFRSVSISVSALSDSIGIAAAAGAAIGAHRALCHVT